MAFENMLDIISIAPLILRDLPLIMGAVQIIGYFFLSLFFGSIAIRGYRGYFNAWVRFGIRLGLGFFCLVMGFAIASFIPRISENPLILMIQEDLLNVLIGGGIASIIVMGAVYLAAYNIFDLERLKKHIRKLEERMRKAEKVKRDDIGKPLVKRIAETHRITGIVILVVLVIFTLMFFRGFPDLNESMLSALGMNQEDLDRLMEQIGADKPMPPGCDNLIIILQQHSDDIVNNRLPISTDSAIKEMVENEGYNVLAMYELVHNGDNYILAVTIGKYMCHIREGVLCSCMDVSPFMTISS